ALALCVSVSVGAARQANVTRGCVDRFDASVDYFPDKVTIDDARNFGVEYRRSFKVVTMREPYPGGPAERYILLQCGAPPPALTLTGGAFSASLATIRNAGVPVVANTEWLEPTALARAEWIKYMALFLNEERQAQQAYSAMKSRYRALSAKATATPRETWP